MAMLIGFVIDINRKHPKAEYIGIDPGLHAAPWRINWQSNPIKIPVTGQNTNIQQPDSRDMFP